jgi:hypothetical protein
MKKYNTLIILNEDDKEVLLMPPEGGYFYGIEKIEGDNFWDGIMGECYNLRSILIHNHGTIKELKKRMDGKENYKIISGSIESIKDQINKIITMMEII